MSSDSKISEELVWVILQLVLIPWRYRQSSQF